MKKLVSEILTVLNVTSNDFKYPFGNKELTATVKDLESKGLIKFNAISKRWSR